MWVIKTEKGSVSSQTLSLFTPHTSQVMPEPGAGLVLAGGGVHSPVFVPAVAVATYWGVRTWWGQLITGCWSPRPTSLWSPMPRCDAGDTGAWSHYQMSWHQVREYWSLPGLCWKCFFMIWNDFSDECYIYGWEYQGYCFTPAVASGLCTRDNARGWHVMIYISPNTVFFSFYLQFRQ